MDYRQILGQSLLLGLLVLRLVLCYPYGAPSETCSTMLPSHGVSPSSTTPPYTITTSKSTYRPNDQITVTLQANSGQNFKGFLLQARKKNSISQLITIGTLTGDSSTWNPCTGQAALTQTNNNIRSTLTMTWTAPAVADGTVVFVATIVKVERTFWTYVQSQDLILNASVPATNAPATIAPTKNSSVGVGVTSTALPSATASSSKATTVSSMGGNTVQCVDPACGKTKGCFHDCDLGDAWTFLMTWANKENSIYFEMKAKIPASDNYWISMGFSSDTEMGDDSVADCSLESGTVKVYSSYNPGKSNSLLDNPTYGVTGTGGKFENGILTCSFDRIKTANLVSSGKRKKRAASSSATFFDLNQDWYLMFALGSGTAASKRQHSTSPKVSQKKADLQSVEDLTAAATVSLVKVHGSMMIVGWILFASIGIVLPRFYKPVWPDSKLCGEKVWFQLHRVCMVLVLLLVAVSFIIIFIHVKGYREIGETRFQMSHPILGIIVMALTIINPVMALFRPHPGAPKRIVFNYAHWGVGTSSHILSIINIFTGVSLGPSDMPKKMQYVLWAYVAWWVAVMIFLEVHDYIQSRKAKKGDDIKLSNLAETNPSAEKPLNVHKWKPWILVIHVVIIVILTIILLVLGNVKKDD
ncbi:hypothetical protein ACJMK2_030787 [Sinanodonta woodiana]|uniref:Ferric-chelate reductase 1 n=1 Tax=Sinanodonta woodiana TaxID=1069815 RepID=A0ABD3X085_SINWO